MHRNAPPCSTLNLIAKYNLISFCHSPFQPLRVPTGDSSFLRRVSHAKVVKWRVSKGIQRASHAHPVPAIQPENDAPSARPVRLFRARSLLTWAKRRGGSCPERVKTSSSCLRMRFYFRFTSHLRIFSGLWILDVISKASLPILSEKIMRAYHTQDVRHIYPKMSHLDTRRTLETR